MLDSHIHIEKGDYTLEWINRFVEAAATKDINEIWLLEHCYFFPEFARMYDKLRTTSEYLHKWFERKAGKRNFNEYMRLVEQVRNKSYPVNIKFGLKSELYVYRIAFIR